jgi:hypothetical protein
MGCCEGNRLGPRTAPLPRKDEACRRAAMDTPGFHAHLDCEALIGELPGRVLRAER